MKDLDIRKIVYPYLQEKYPDALHVPEVWLYSSSVADIITVNDSIIGWEIKSDADTLTRLPKQSKEYQDQCQYNWIITTDKYVDKVKELLPDYWGIINVSSGFVSIVREASLSDDFKPICMLSWLSSKQLKKILRDNNIKGYSRLLTYELRLLISNSISDEIIIQSVIGILKSEKEYWLLRKI